MNGDGWWDRRSNDDITAGSEEYYNTADSIPAAYRGETIVTSPAAVAAAPRQSSGLAGPDDNANAGEFFWKGHNIK
jgi:hypothetical protein